MTQIAFEWPSSADANVAGYYLYRSNPHAPDEGMKKVAKIPDRFATHYVDTNLEPSTEYHYELRSYDKNGNVSDRGEVISVSTERLIESVSFAQVINNLPGRAKILWRPHPDTRVASYIIERNVLESKKWEKIAEIKGRLNVEYIDTNLDPNRQYNYRIFVRTSEGIVSSPSEVFSATTKPLPKSISNLKATTDLPKKIILTWDADASGDFSHYAVYSSSNSIVAPMKVAEVSTNRYEDPINENGAIRYYRVTAVDRDGQEGRKQSEKVQGMTLASPLAPQLISTNFSGSSVELAWSGDARCVNYAIYKDGPSGETEIDVGGATSYSDGDIKQGAEYKYSVICSDEYGLDSPKSNKAVIEIK